MIGFALKLTGGVVFRDAEMVVNVRLSYVCVLVNKNY
jgi:hypothetical protein